MLALSHMPLELSPDGPPGWGGWTQARQILKRMLEIIMEGVHRYEGDRATYRRGPPGIEGVESATPGPVMLG
jgi:hypothetical protein